MSTNYYFTKGKTECSCCGSTIDKEYHIGKKSYGWEFSFQGYKDLNLNSFIDYDNFFETHIIRIYNEYNEDVLWEDLRSVVLQSKILTNKNQTVEVKQNYSSSISREYFLDEDDFSFTYTDFS